ncbi:DUF1573 domain-containing protein [Opitutus sp. ER46]|uniref:DUF1573 domain-containing protein n=1 Tax=Opitutus sp. ER46 TaxID=2161864 RepID=UPI000D2FB48A|nr:DUF1573 domain-containing protein [Opitutus sp. ER46]PTX91724.1 hypothetical protein DB354_17840 [Opitutus sp. ER46]
MHPALHVRRPALGAVLALVLLAGAAGAAPGAKPESTAVPAVMLPERAHDFGRVPQGTVLRHGFTLRNEGGRTLRVIDLLSSCGCTTTPDWPRELAPGASGVISVALDTTQFAGPITKTITVVTDDPRQPRIGLELKADIWTPLSLSQPTLLFPALSSPDATMTRSITLRREVEGTLAVTKLQSSNPRFAAAAREISPGKEYELTVTLVPPLAEGTHTGRITLETGLAELPTLQVPVVAIVLPAVQVAPTEMAFSSPRLAAEEKRFAVILSHRGAKIEVSDVSTDAPGVTFATTAKPDGRQVTLVLTFPAGFALPPEGGFVLRGRTNHPAHPTFSIPIVYRAD